VMALQWLIVFSATTLADVCWARYMAHVAVKNRLRASAWSAAIICCGCVSVIEYTQNRWLVTAAIAGAFVGTWFGVGKNGDK
jgi:hypothetical protein